MIPTVMDDEIANKTDGSLIIIVGKDTPTFEIWFNNHLLESIRYNKVVKRSYKGCKNRDKKGRYIARTYYDFFLRCEYKQSFLVDKDVMSLMTPEQIKILSDQATED